MAIIIIILVLASVILFLAAIVLLIHRWGLRRCFPSYLIQIPKRRRPKAAGPIHLLLCFADHYEPKSQGASREEGLRRVQKWVEEYPKQFGQFRDSGGKPPQYTFFFPIEEYEEEYLDLLAELCRQGYGEVEVHYHHDQDTAENLRSELLRFKQVLADKHGLLSRDKETGEIAYGFIHGNWALCNGFGNGRWCGVNNEIEILRETGCYADFTMPSAPSATQTAKVNSIYYAVDKPGRPRSHDWGVDIGTGAVPQESLLLIQGPLILDWKRRKRKVFPSLENGCIQASQPVSISRLESWLKARVQVPTRPDWYFVKLHMHGASEDAHEVLLGEPMVQFHRDLGRYAAEHLNFHFHYVTAREMYNLAKAAEAGWKGSVDQARDFLVESAIEKGSGPLSVKHPLGRSG